MKGVRIIKNKLIYFLEEKKNKILKSPLAFDILSIIKNKEKIIEQQERFKVNSIESMERLKLLLDEHYQDSTLILQAMNDGFTNYLTIISIKNRDDYHIKLDSLVRDYLGNDYIVAIEEMIVPRAISFSNEKHCLYLLNYDVGVVDF